MTLFSGRLFVALLVMVSITVFSCSNNNSTNTDQNEYYKQYDEELAKKDFEKQKMYKQLLEEEKQKLEEERQKLEEEKQRIEEERIKQEEERREREREREAKEKTLSQSTRKDSYNYSNGYTTVFNNVYDVLAYTNNIFREPTSGTIVSIREDALYVDGAPVTGAPEILSFNRCTAVIRVHSPYLGGSALTIRVDASRGTLTDGAGDVYYKK